MGADTASSATPPAGGRAPRLHRTRCARRRELLEQRVEARRIIGSVTQADVDDADRRLTAAQDAAARAEKERARAESVLAELHRTAESLRAHGAPSDEDRRLVTACEERGLPERFTRYRRLLEGHSEREAEYGRLHERYRALVDQARQLRSDAEKAVIDSARVVATTPARSRVHRAVANRTFDVVLVDEAGAVSLVEVLLALCRGTTTAVLFGDFLQLGPVLDGVKRDDPLVEKWVRATCFSHVGIRSPRDAERHRSCIALTHQFRFGPTLRRLASDVIYQVLRDTAELPTVNTRPRTEIVLIDVSTVPELGVIRSGTRSGRWWTAGVLLSRALAEAHLPEGPVGLVTPYRTQADATLAALHDRKIVAGAAVGTGHSFQGREYPTVVFDLVDEGKGWIARGRLTAGTWEADGLKAFGVGITRARNRLYVLVHRPACNRPDQARCGSFNAASNARTRRCGVPRRCSA